MLQIFMGEEQKNAADKPDLILFNIKCEDTWLKFDCNYDDFIQSQWKNSSFTSCSSDQ